MPARPGCPTCSGELADSRSISVCARCHDRLLARGDIPLASTGEFAVMTPAMATELLEAGATKPAASSAAGVRCTWCGKARAEIKKLLSSGAAHICNECVGLCADIMAAELGDDWR